MPKFRYKMQNVLDIKRKLESLSQAQFQLANTNYLREQQKLQELLVRRAGYDKVLKEKMEGRLDVREINRARADATAAKNMVRRQMMEVHKAEKKLDAAREELSQLMKERKTQEKLKEHAFDAFQKEMGRTEAKEIDELVSYSFHSK